MATTYLTALLFGLLPALGNISGSFLAEQWEGSENTLKLGLLISVGFILAVIGIVLLPIVLESSPAWLFLALFFAGGFISIRLDRVTDLVATRTATGETDVSPWRVYDGIAVDLFSDGVMIGFGLTITLGLGFLLTISQIPAYISEGFATIKTFKSRGVPRHTRLLMVFSFAVPIFLGVTAGYWLGRRSGIIAPSLLAFTAGILVAVTVEEILPKAYREDEDRLVTVELVGSFTLIMLIAMYLR